MTTGSGTDATACIDGFTITAGYADGWSFVDKIGAGMLNDAGSPTVSHCTFSGNAAYHEHEVDFLEEGFGAGMANRNGSNPMIAHCTFSGNWAATDGGGMYNSGSSPTVTHCTFSDNFAGEDGGGMADVGASDSMVTHCTFSGNTASLAGGGGMSIHNSSSTVINSIFSGNQSSGWGGGIIVGGLSSPSATVKNCTFSGNVGGSTTGGGIYVSAGSASLDNCILWGNAPTQIGGGAPVVSYSLVGGSWAGTGNIDADPLFVDADAGDLRLQSGSPAIDAGDNAAVPVGITTDLDGNPRIVDGTGDSNAVVDMGAYEYQPTGACCLPDGSCGDDVSVAVCIAAFGIFQGDGASCAEATCPDSICNDPFADADGDGDVDLADFAVFQRCLADFYDDPYCICFDQAAPGGELGADDFTAFVDCFTGPTILHAANPNPNCAAQP